MKSRRRSEHGDNLPLAAGHYMNTLAYMYCPYMVHAPFYKYTLNFGNEEVNNKKNISSTKWSIKVDGAQHKMAQLTLWIAVKLCTKISRATYTRSFCGWRQGLDVKLVRTVTVKAWYIRVHIMHVLGYRRGVWAHHSPANKHIDKKFCSWRCQRAAVSPPSAVVSRWH